MTIALIAHDSKKELMVQFCTAYCRILSQHKLVATGTTGKLIAEATGLQVQRFLAGVQGGDQQIASRIACNEIDLLLFFRANLPRLKNAFCIADTAVSERNPFIRRARAAQTK